MKKISILGSTGSIGVSTLEVVAEHADRFDVVAMTAGTNLDLFVQQIVSFRPQLVAVVSAGDAARLRDRLGDEGPEVVSGVEGLIACATHAEAGIVVSAIVGAAGLVPTMAAIEAGKDIALANKETLVTAGALVMRAVAEYGVKLYPVDSEHSAIFQSLEGHRDKDVKRLILTASGGPFRERDPQTFDNITLEDALAHPNWNMGQKITIDSATMMNKGLEVIEAHWLFGLPGDRISVHIHPQSIVHSMVEYIDGSVIAQLGVPDMKTPIAYALSYPERLPLDLPPLDLCQLGQLTFMEPDSERFPCLDLAYAALAAGGSAPAALNAANEVAVDAFLNGRISYLGIPELIEEVMSKHQVVVPGSIDDVLQVDQWARREADGIL
ncbi:MAG: 1-deoxy-D-xylulose-5-phosphate reductoisomerase [Desulfuromonas sp.]|nr:MAG: 1-deoxy-D-xylulose-5-phosphate reductoisomerase [Desulfuromonas sp.]